MQLNDTPREILTRLNNALDENSLELISWQHQLISEQKYELAIQFRELINEINTLNKKVNLILKGDS